MTLSREGRPSGEAYVELESEEDQKKALTMNHKHMGARFASLSFLDESQSVKTLLLKEKSETVVRKLVILIIQTIVGYI